MGHAWQERPPLQRTVSILLECILVLFIAIRITDRMGQSPILYVIHTITIGTMPSDNGHELKNVTCE